MTGLVADGSLWLAGPIAVLAGIVSFVSPCVLPLVPGYLGFIGGAVTTGGRPRPVGAAHDTAGGAGATTVTVAPARARLVGGVLLFIAGFTVVFMVMNFLGGTAGRLLLAYQGPITRIMGVVLILMGLVFTGVFRFAQRSFHPHVHGTMGLAGAPLLGMALGVGWVPCIGPTLAVILGMSVGGGSAGRGAFLGLLYSLGLGIPFLLIAVGAGWATRSVAFLRRHIRPINLVGGAMLVVLGLLMLTGVWTAVMSQLQGVIVGATPAL